MSSSPLIAGVSLEDAYRLNTYSVSQEVTLSLEDSYGANITVSWHMLRVPHISLLRSLEYSCRLNTHTQYQSAEVTKPLLGRYHTE
ncbi:hypothetical protein AVEN_92780-1 [Araneus ventricosus]|uniref:Ubiquitin-like domain-containing protein n=1 Tax=Araneus ventricosus TaxID=182803 RepID=A0A4Y2MAM1_ARAVE|nr:hypothetical protein AVEN_92780-1 [Araneus ventricosus]